MDNQYTVDSFIEKFTKIPDAEWCVDQFTSSNGKQHCALGHCGMISEKIGGKMLFPTSEASALMDLFVHAGLDVGDVNDGKCSNMATEATPKARILGVLNRIKEKKI